MTEQETNIIVVLFNVVVLVHLHYFVFPKQKDTQKILSSLENKVVVAARITALFFSKMIMHEHSH